MTVTVQPKDVIILEGILVLEDEHLRNLMDIKVFVDTDADVRILRRLERDMKTRDTSLDSVIQQYLTVVRPMHLQFMDQAAIARLDYPRRRLQSSRCQLVDQSNSNLCFPINSRPTNSPQ